MYYWQNPARSIFNQTKLNISFLQCVYYQSNTQVLPIGKPNIKDTLFNRVPLSSALNKVQQQQQQQKSMTGLFVQYIHGDKIHIKNRQINTTMTCSTLNDENQQT